MIDGYVYMAVLCAYTGISRQDIYVCFRRNAQNRLKKL